MTFAHNGKSIVGTLTPENISIGSSNTVYKKPESLENRNKEFKNIPHTTAITVTSRKTIRHGSSCTYNTSDFIISIDIVKTTISTTLSNTDDTALPIRTATRLLGDRYISSRVPLYRSKENLQAD
jgi:hypothetical protein